MKPELRTFLFSILIVGTVTVLVPALLLILTRQQPQLHLIGLASGFPILLTGILIYARCALDFVMRGGGTPDPGQPPVRLVVSGLYRWSRNPMYLGVLLIPLGEAVLFQSALLVFYVALLWSGFHLRVIAYEEPVLRTQFGVEYENYTRQVPRWFGILRRVEVHLPH